MRIGVGHAGESLVKVEGSLLREGVEGKGGTKGGKVTLGRANVFS